MNSVINIYKPVGKTPLEVIRQIKSIFPEYTHETLGYAGRLDPMAEGVLLVLKGEENKKRKEYERYDKKYSFEVLFGVETDTYDILGLLSRIQNISENLPLQQLQRYINEYIGTWEQPYPPYSSPRVNGRPLFYWARHNALDTIKIPSKKITVHSLEMEALHKMTSSHLLSYIEKKISTIQGDFRQSDILKLWRNELSSLSCSFTYARFAIECSSGLYIRSLAHDLGKKLNTDAIALSITRTAVGPYLLSQSLRIRDTSEKTK